MFDNVPFISKWITVKSYKAFKFRIDLIEKLSLNWQWSQQGYDWLQIVPEQPRGTKVEWITEVFKYTFYSPFIILVKFMSIAISALTIGASSKQKSEGTLRGCVNQSETLRLKFKHLFQLVAFCTAHNL